MTTILYVTVSQQSNTDGICPLLSIYTTQGVTDLGLDSSDSEAENPHLMGKKTNHQVVSGQTEKSLSQTYSIGMTGFSLCIQTGATFSRKKNFRYVFTGSEDNCGWKEPQEISGSNSVQL